MSMPAWKDPVFREEKCDVCGDTVEDDDFTTGTISFEGTDQMFSYDVCTQCMILYFGAGPFYRGEELPAYNPSSE